MPKFTKENSIPHQVLMTLGELLELGIELLIWDFDSLSKRAGFRSLYQIPRPLFYRGLNDLKKNKFIETKFTKNGKEIYLTKKGGLEIMRYKMKLKTENLKWDGKWRGVCWDIPEVSKRDRNFLRGLLKWLGFKELQKSFWIFPYEIKNELKEFIRFFKEELAGDIRFLTIERIEDDADFREYFNLN